MKITHVIIGLGVGGAELMLKRLVEAHLMYPEYKQSIVSLTSVGKVGLQLRALGIEIHALDIRSTTGGLVGLLKLVRLLRKQRPDIVQTWMYHADLLGGLAARMVGVKGVIWGVRNTLIPPGRKSRTHLVISLCAKLSQWLPLRIVCCAESARSAHVDLGYSAEKMVVIPNGYELSVYTPLPALRQSMRLQLGFSDDVVVIGIVGRFDPLKDYENFVHAAARVSALRPQVRFMMVGRDVISSNIQLMAWIANTGIPDRFILLGERPDVADCMAAMDIYCLASRAEGFPNVVAEAMAMHVPCVVTDVGDAASIVQDTGRVAPPRDPSSLADALISMVDLSHIQRQDLGIRARKIIENKYSIKIIAKLYSDLYLSLNSNLKND